ncbi:hypothetical protein [Stenotrophomonas oahuensis]|uniref:DUF3955 domain-containing protein n=1 Tax=Stenotrophomonas oahuensis TaxID=3003271 RepID=A0ABY9YUV7_9GAMM|nr:hypothetical protein [Stenotrophomonas sp. A5586]WNH54804.1 hypothetical protein PDM29_20890 [Stenotrophomonas sp. A5586]
MKNTTKLAIVAHSPQLLFATALIVGAVYGLATFTPSPPELPYVTFTDTFGIPIYVVGIASGVFFLLRAIRGIRAMIK